ncbi:MAG: trigger factor [Dehalococcoidia bacterium]|nr:trigger factor [Dehalococcoidia bacterium]
MKVTREKLENCQVSLNIEAEARELEKALDEAYHRLVSKVSIPGFRKGKTPRAILEQHLGKSTLLEEALERLIPQLYKQAIESEKIEPIAQPQIEVTQNEPLVFKAIVPLKPTVKLGDYHSIKLKAEPVEIGEGEIGAAIEQLRQQQAVLLPVDRPVQLGDFVTLSIEATIEGKPFLNHKDLLYQVDSNSTFPLPEFAQKLEGVKKNEERIFSLKVPADYSIKEFCGQECLFKTTISEIKEKQLPQLDDEFAQSCNYANLTQLREGITADLRAKAEQRSHLELRQKAIDAVVKVSEVDYPPILEDREIDSLLEDMARRFGYREVEDYLKRVSKTEEELREELRPVAKKRVINSLTLDKVAEEEKVEITSPEVDNKVEEILGDAKDKEKMRRFLALPQVRESIEQSLRSQKTMERLVQIISGNEKEETGSRLSGEA